VNSKSHSREREKKREKRYKNPRKPFSNQQKTRKKKTPSMSKKRFAALFQRQV
jgi:hypothetical protein